MTTKAPSCCARKDDHQAHSHAPARFHYILWGSVSIIVTTVALYYAGLNIPHIEHFVRSVFEFLGTMWWGILIGLLVVGLMNKIPKEYFQAMLVRGDTYGGIFRAAMAGLVLDMCNHGILMVGAKLYERGASLAQVMTFLIASPWNSLSLTIILFTLVGVKWTLAFIVFSAVIAIISGFIFMALVKRGILPDNPNKVDMPTDFSVISDAKIRLKNFKPTPKFFVEIVTGGLHEA